MLWTGISVPSLNWLRTVSDWSAIGPREWLCFLLVLIHVALLLATLWVWMRPKPELLVLDTGRGTDSGWGVAAFPIAVVAFWVSGRLDGWLSSLATTVGVLGFCAVAILMLRDIRAARKVARRVTDNQHGDGS